MKHNTIAFQGEHGAYSEEAAYKLLGDKIFTWPRPTFESVFESVTSGKCDYGIIPIENSSIGSIHQNYDLLLKYNLFITDEITIPINHCIIALTKIRIANFEYIYSHPAALAQCNRFITKHPGIKAIYYYDTAGAAKMVKESGKKNLAAIASAYAADKYRLNVIKHSIQDNKNNRTCFFLIGRKLIIRKTSSVTSLVFSVVDNSDTLAKVILMMSTNNVNIKKIESRTNRRNRKQKIYLIDIEASLPDIRIKRIVKQLPKFTQSFKILGSY